MVWAARVTGEAPDQTRLDMLLIFGFCTGTAISRPAATCALQAPRDLMVTPRPRTHLFGMNLLVFIRDDLIDGFAELSGFTVLIAALPMFATTTTERMVQTVC